jgi:hypothetical protein
MRKLDEDGFLIISECYRDQHSDTRQLNVSKQVSIRVASGDVPTESDKADDHEMVSEQDSDQSRRFVQYSFWDKFVICDLPNTTLTRFEGRKIIRDLPGFAYIRERPDYPYYRDAIADFDPLQKQYLPNDMESAASDAATIFFQIWKFPVDTRLVVSASAFDAGIAWSYDEVLT